MLKDYVLSRLKVVVEGGNSYNACCKTHLTNEFLDIMEQIELENLNQELFELLDEDETANK